MVGTEGRTLLHRFIVQGKPVVRRGRKARDLLEDRPAADPPVLQVDSHKGVHREGEPGALHGGPDASGVSGPHPRCRHPLGPLTKSVLEAPAFRTARPAARTGSMLVPHPGQPLAGRLNALDVGSPMPGLRPPGNRRSRGVRPTMRRSASRAVRPTMRRPAAHPVLVASRDRPAAPASKVAGGHQCSPGGCTITGRLVDCADRPGSPGSFGRPFLGLFDGRNRRHVAIAIRADGRRVQMPLNDAGLSDGSLLGLLRSLVVGLESLLGLLITGSRRENGGTRRDGR